MLKVFLKGFSAQARYKIYLMEDGEAKFYIIGAKQ